jgi:hydroxymethylglutaryl-CoA reductase
VNQLSINGFDGASVAERIAEATDFANNDPYRAATHNKGVMNGIDPIVIATGNDWRAIEAGAHAYAARDGQYRSLTEWRVDGEYLLGRIEVPMALGVVGGVTAQHPMASVALKMMKISNASELAMVIASVGLAQNLSALRALVSEGIQKGHMRMHAKNIAVSAGAQPHEVEMVAEMLTSRVGAPKLGLSGSSLRAKEILQEIRSSGYSPSP